MKLYIQQYIETHLREASYEYDDQTQSWCAWIENIPGVYAQSKNLEDVRNQLAEVLEDFILVSFYNHELVTGLERFAKPLPYDTQAS